MDHTRYLQAKKITLIGAGINVLLGFLKLVGGYLFHSHALIADGFHSFSDLITDVMVLFASKYGNQAADETHHYGHQRIETAATLLLALLLILAGTAIAWDSLDEMIHKSHSTPGWLTLPIAGFSIIANELLFHYTQYVGKKIKSELIIANAWHHRSDAASSIVVLLGIMGSISGIVYLDAVAAVIVGFMIINMGLSYGWNSVKELVDTAVELQIINSIEHIILQVDGVQKIHQLRTRSMGSDILIDVHVLVSPFISVSEGHYIAQHVHQALVRTLENIKDVIVHIDPEDDERCSPSLHLPSRKTLEQTWLNPWQQTFHGVLGWVLHYLDGKLLIDIQCDETFDQWDDLMKRIQSDTHGNKSIGTIRLFKNELVISK